MWILKLKKDAVARAGVLILLNEPREILFGLLLLEDFNSHVVDSAVVKYNNTSVGPGFDVYTTVFAEVVITAAEVVAYGLNGGVEPVCNLSLIHI